MNLISAVRNAAPYIGILAGVSSALLGVFLGNAILQHSAVVLGLASATYLIYLHRYSSTKRSLQTDGASKNSRLPVLSLVWISVFLLIGIAVLHWHGSSPYFVMIAAVVVVAAAIVYEIVSLPRIHSPSHVLAQIIILSIVVRATVYYQYPSLLGGDPWFHSSLVARIASDESIPPIAGYQFFPVLHILAVVAQDLLGLGVKDALFVAIIFEPISLVFLYLVTRHLFGSITGLLGMLILSVSNFHIYWGYYPTPAAITLGFFLLSLYLMFVLHRKNSAISSLLLLLVMTAVILTHPLSTFIIVSSLFLVLGLHYTFRLIASRSRHAYKTSIPVGVSVALFSAIAMIGYWMFASGHIGYVADSIRFAFQFAEPLLELQENPFGTSILISWLPVYIFMFFFIIGSYKVVSGFPHSSSQRNHDKYLLLGTALSLTLLIFLIIMLNLGRFFPWRWLVFIFVAASPFAAIGLVVFGSIPHQRQRGRFLIVAASLLLAGIMFTSSLANINENLLPSDNAGRQAFLTSEIAAARWVARYGSLGPVFTDWYFTHVLRYGLGVGVNDASSFLSQGLGPEGMIIIRDELRYRTTPMSGGVRSIIDSSIFEQLTAQPPNDLIFDSGSTVVIHHH